MTKLADLYFIHQIASGELSKGGTVRMDQILLGPSWSEARPTGVVQITTRQTSSSEEVRQVFLGRREFPSIAEALVAWRTL